MKNLKWKTAWVIGGSTGMGREAVKILDQKNVETFVSARTEAPLAELCAQSKNVKMMVLDVTEQASVRNEVDKLVKRLGKLPDLIVINAAIYKPMNGDTLDSAEIKKMVEVNYLGVVHVIEALFKYKNCSEKCTVATVTSPSGWRGLPNSAGYGPSKAAAINFIEGLKSELKDSNLDLRLVNPGFIRTRLTAKNDFKMPQLMEPEFAAQKMLDGLSGNKFDITFPNPFLLYLKFLRILPYRLYFWITKRL